MESQPKLLVKSLKGFPVLAENSKIKTTEFLEAAKEVVEVIEKFGKIFSPIVIDMNGNIEKLQKCYKQNEEKNMYLQDMVHQDIMSTYCTTKDALLWLKRALELIESFFTNILNDKKLEENLQEHLRDAYNNTLKAYHGWIVQQTFSLIYRWVPYRSQLIGTDKIHDENINGLEKYLPTMKINLTQIDTFLKLVISQ